MSNEGRREEGGDVLGCQVAREGKGSKHRLNHLLTDFSRITAILTFLKSRINAIIPFHECNL